MANQISELVNGITDSFINVAVAAIVIAFLFTLSIVNGSEFVSTIETKLQDGMVQLVSIVVLIVLLIALRYMQTRSS